jgi:uncharacterized protein YycO
MTSYTIVWRIDTVAQSPRDAAEWAANVLKEEPYDWEYEVTNDETGEVTYVDLDEENCE